MSDPRLTDCPECKQASLKKQLTAAAFQLKGTGWYETDFKNSGKKPESKSGTDSTKNTASTDSATKTESSSATTSTEAS